jgi:hypothetical protein
VRSRRHTAFPSAVTWPEHRQSLFLHHVIFFCNLPAQADILADRKAVLSKGRVQCVGSSLFLKSRFGVGYHLNISLKPGADADAVACAVESHIPQAKREVSTAKMEASLSLPTSTAAAFPKLFDSLSERRAELNIGSFGINVTSLEEVFLQLAKREEDQDAVEAKKSKQASPAGSESANKHSLNCENDVTAPLTQGKRHLSESPAPTSRRRVLAVMRIRWKQARRNWRALFFQVGRFEGVGLALLVSKSNRALALICQHIATTIAFFFLFVT